MVRLPWTAIGGILALSFACAAGAEPSASFEGLGALPGRFFLSYARDVSADGRVVVGLSGGRGFRWEDGVIEDLDSPVPALDWAHGVSADGQVIVGQDRSGGYRLEGGVLTWLEDGPRPSSSLFAVSDDGAVSVGFRSSRAIRWEDGVVTLLGDLPGGNELSLAYDVASDGSAIAGRVSSELGFEAFRWEDGVMTGLGEPTRAFGTSDAVAISPDGSVVVGKGIAPEGVLAFRWEDGEVTILGDLPGGSVFSNALAVSRRGRVIVGESSSADGTVAFVWDEAHGMRDLQEVLEVESGLDLTGWYLTRATDITGDGLTIVGDGTNPDGEAEAWLVRLPDPTIAVEIDVKPGNPTNPINPMSRGVVPVAILGSEGLDVGDLDLTTLTFGPDGSAPVHEKRGHPRDVNGDGHSDLVSYFRTQEAGFPHVFGQTDACLTGEMLDGTPIAGCDTVLLLGACGLGFELVFVLPPIAWLRGRSRRRKR